MTRILQVIGIKNPVVYQVFQTNGLHNKGTEVRKKSLNGWNIMINMGSSLERNNSSGREGFVHRDGLEEFFHSGNLKPQ